MANSIRIHPTISLVANQHLEAAIARGETLSGIINRLLIHQLPKPDGASTSSSAPATKTPTTTLRANLKAIRAMIARKKEEYEDLERKDITITFAQKDEQYELYKKAAEYKFQLKELIDTTPEQVMRDHYQRELDRLSTQHEAEEEDLFNPLATPEFHKQYRERLERINVLKDRLK